MTKISKRQQKILDFLKKNGQSGNKQINEFLGNEISRFTVLREIRGLLESGLIEVHGQGRGVYYEISSKNDLLEYYPVDEYFVVPVDKRQAQERFDFKVFDKWHGVFLPDEAEELSRLNDDYKNRIKRLSPGALKKEFERLTIELSWKSSAIEGNTYSLIDTEILIKEHKEARGKKKEEAVMILNHKKALEFAKDKKSGFRKLSLGQIENLHSLIVDGLGVSKGIRKKAVGITGTKFRPLDNVHQIREALEKMIKTINQAGDPFTKALGAVLLASYIQPFEDGNKRTARLLGDAVLLAHGACPLSYRSVDEAEYKKATLLFYEQNSAYYFKELFTEQFKFAVNNYFRA